MASFGVDTQPARPAMAYKTTPSAARKRSFGKTPDLHPPPQGMDVCSERETRRATPGTSTRQCLHRGSPPPWHRIRCRSGWLRTESPSEEESGPTSTEEKGWPDEDYGRSSAPLRTPRDD